MVAYRGENDGKVGVLHAFCPHAGAHLGEEGGYVEGNVLVCPMHRWKFDRKGTCTRGRVRRTKAYPVREILNVVYIWFHASEEFADTPQWELSVADDLEAVVKSGQWHEALVRETELGQHLCEIALSSTEKSQLGASESPSRFPVFQNVITGSHTTQMKYEQGIVNGELVGRKELAVLTAETRDLHFFGQGRIAGEHDPAQGTHGLR
ncbi:hypothetical protein CYMTET_51718 [Cymbomonas tetramitiformis]|uniref:Rieske domain-containing protein n=1 Tax=Cymbomonas tetramitiformis TaxID=36881 RepID=A0AAE0BKG7_9CHLO|nr:hypothetical protein CYMTET_51718 [Cymbomonas tetramitiformis]